MRKISAFARLGLGTLVVGILSLVLAVGLPSGLVKGADHVDAPALTSPGDGDGRLDINDLYVFQSPENPDNTVMIMTLNPFSVPGPNYVLHHQAEYDFNVDNNGDAASDREFHITVKKPDLTGAQEVRIRGNGVNDRGMTDEIINLDNGGRLLIADFDDPFYFDLLAFLGVYSFCNAPGGPGGSTGSDFFAGFNVTGIVLEVPTKKLTKKSANIGVWVDVDLKRHAIDRMGRPAINTVLIPTELKDDFNESPPRQDVKRYTKTVVASLINRFGRTQADAEALAAVLLPDVLTMDTSSNAGFLNGRKLADDVIDAELNLLSNGALTGDCVDTNDKPFSTSFPYLASPN